MLFDADAVCRAAFCREVAQGAGPRLHDAALCAVLVFLWTVEKNLPAEQAAIVERKKGATK